MRKAKVSLKYPERVIRGAVVDDDHFNFRVIQGKERTN